VPYQRLSRQLSWYAILKEHTEIRETGLAVKATFLCEYHYGKSGQVG
jgi:hypothetical protein